MNDISEWKGDDSPLDLPRTTSRPARSDSTRTPVEAEGSRTTVTTNLPSSVQYLPDERDIKLPDFASHIQQIQDWESGRLESSALPSFVAARGTYEQGKLDLKHRYKIDPRGEYAAKIRKEHCKKISDKTDWWLGKDGRKHLVSASCQGKIPGALDIGYVPARPAMQWEIARVTSPSTVNRNHGQDLSIDVIATRRDLKATRLQSRETNQDGGSTTVPPPAQPSSENSGVSQDVLDLSQPFGFTFEDEKPNQTHAGQEEYKLLDQTYLTLDAKQKKRQEQTERIFAESMGRIHSKLKAADHLFSMAYRQRNAKRAQPISNGETVYAVQSVFSARRWRCRPVIAHRSEVLRQPMRFTLVSWELYDELGRGERVLRMDEWEDLERRFTCVGANAKILERLKAGDIEGAMAHSVNQPVGRSATPQMTRSADLEQAQDWARFTNPRNRAIESAPTPKSSLFPTSSVHSLMHRSSSRPHTADGRGLVRPARQRRGVRAASACTTSSSADSKRLAVGDLGGSEGSRTRSARGDEGAVEAWKTEDDDLQQALEEANGSIAECAAESSRATDSSASASASASANPLDLFDDEGLAELLKQTPISTAVRDSAKRRLEGVTEKDELGHVAALEALKRQTDGQSTDEEETEILELADEALDSPLDGRAPTNITEATDESEEKPAEDPASVGGRETAREGEMQIQVVQEASSEGLEERGPLGGDHLLHPEMVAALGPMGEGQHEELDLERRAQMIEAHHDHGEEERQDEAAAPRPEPTPTGRSGWDGMRSISPVTSVTMSPKTLKQLGGGPSVRLVMAGYDVGTRVSLPKLLEPLQLKPKQRTFRWAMQLLSHVCVDKMLADAADIGAGVPRSRFSLYLRQWTLRRFGIQAVADQQLVDLCATLRRYKDATMEAKLLWRCCKDKLSAGQLALFLHARELLGSASSVDGDRFAAAEAPHATATVPTRSVHAVANMALAFTSADRRRKVLAQLADDATPAPPQRSHSSLFLPSASPPPIGLYKPALTQSTVLSLGNESPSVSMSMASTRGEPKTEVVSLDRTLLRLVTAYGAAVKELRSQLRDEYEDMLDEMTRGMPRDGEQGRPLGSCVPAPAMVKFVRDRFPQAPAERFESFLRQLMAVDGAEDSEQLVDFQTVELLDDAVDLMGYDKRWERLGNGDLTLLVDERKSALWAQHNMDLSGLSAPRRMMKASMLRMAKESSRRQHLRRSLSAHAVPGKKGHMQTNTIAK